MDFNKQMGRYHFDFGGMCSEYSLQSIPINFTQLVMDMFNETKHVNIYEPNATHLFDNDTALHVFHTRKIFSGDIGKI